MRGSTSHRPRALASLGSQGKLRLRACAECPTLIVTRPEDGTNRQSRAQSLPIIVVHLWLGQERLLICGIGDICGSAARGHRSDSPILDFLWLKIGVLPITLVTDTMAQN